MGKTKTSHPLYPVWNQMKARCYNPKSNRYHNYGGRGIEVCWEWRNDFWAFEKWANRSGWRKGYQIDRINTDGNYEPDNCRWVTPKDNNRNRRNNRLVTYLGVTKTLSEWADDDRSQVSYKVLWERMQDGWKFEKALLTPMRRKNGYRVIRAWEEEKSITEWVEDPRCPGVNIKTLWKRINDGWVPERAISTPPRSR